MKEVKNEKTNHKNELNNSCDKEIDEDNHDLELFQNKIKEFRGKIILLIY